MMKKGATYVEAPGSTNGSAAFPHQLVRDFAAAYIRWRRAGGAQSTLGHREGRRGHQRGQRGWRAFRKPLSEKLSCKKTRNKKKTAKRYEINETKENKE